MTHKRSGVVKPLDTLLESRLDRLFPSALRFSPKGIVITTIRSMQEHQFELRESKGKMAP